MKFRCFGRRRPGELVRNEFFKVDKNTVWFPKLLIGAKLTDDEMEFLETHETLSPNDKVKWVRFYGPLQEPRRPRRITVNNLALFLTTSCNLRCVYCYGSGGEIDLPDLTLEEIEAFLKVFKTARGIMFHGWGEPTLRFDLIREVVKKHGRRYQYSIGTNGVYGSSRHRVEIARFLAENKFGVTLSLDSIPEINDRQRPRANGEGSTAEVLETMRVFKKYGVQFGVRAGVSAGGLDYMEDFLYFMKKLGVRGFKIEPVFESGRARRERDKSEFARMPDLLEFGRNLVGIWKLGQKIGVKVDSTYLPFKVRRSFCGATEGSCLVLYNTRLIGTCWEEMLNPSSPFVVGKMEKSNGDYRVFIFRDRLERLHERSHIALEDERCRRCPLKYSCSGGCPFKSYEHYGDLEHPGENPQSCRARREVLKLILSGEP